MARIAQCWKCGHETRQHQPCYGNGAAPSSTGQTVGCAECDCQITMAAKLRFWQVVS